MALVPHHQAGPRQFAWTIPTALQLIRERRALNDQFVARHGNRSHEAVWNVVANNLFAATGFQATGDQYKSKWNTLRRGIIFFNIIIVNIFRLF